MKQSHLLIITLVIASMTVFGSANLANCQQVPHMSPMAVPPAGSAWPPSVYGPPVSCVPPLCGPQNYSQNNLALGSGLSWLTKACGSGNVPTRLTAQVGYGYIGFNYTMRPPTQEGVQGNAFISNMFPNLDLAFTDASVAMGSFEAREDSCSGLFLAFRGQANLPRNIGIQTPQEWYPVRNWEGSKVQWWTLEGYTGFRVTPCWSALLGLRREELSVSFTHGPITLPVVVLPETNFSPVVGNGNASSKLWLPYIGLEFTGRNYRASFLWSPFAAPDVAVSLRHFWSETTTLLPPDSGQFQHQKSLELDYGISKRAGDFIEYNVEYNLDTGSRFTFQLWSRGNWMWVRGRGDFRELVNDFLTVSDRPPFVPLFNGPAFYATDDSTATCTRWMVTGGIATVLFF
jgi:hypothetical protein